MNTPYDNNGQSPCFRPPEDDSPPFSAERHLLLPTKVSYITHPPGTHSSPSPCANPNGPARWTSQPVLEWVESLATAAETAEVLSSPGIRTSPITIGGIALGEPSPAIAIETHPPSIASSSRLTNTSLPCNWCPEGDIRDVSPKRWDLTYLANYDPMSWMFVQSLREVAVRIEQLLEHGIGLASNQAREHLDVAYRMAHSRLEFTFHRIMSQFPYGTPPECGELRFLLDALYSETIQKLEDLLTEATGKSTASSGAIPAPPDLQNGMHSSVPSTSSCTPSNGSIPSSDDQPKQELSTYMTGWLLENWTNPYPDEAGLVQMANICNTTPGVVSNWLINARTRKWRPSIIKATQRTDRPSAVLLEDSIRIFQGEPLRELASGKISGPPSNNLEGAKNAKTDSGRKTCSTKRRADTWEKEKGVDSSVSGGNGTNLRGGKRTKTKK